MFFENRMLDYVDIYRREYEARPWARKRGDRIRSGTCGVRFCKGGDDTWQGASKTWQEERKARSRDLKGNTSSKNKVRGTSDM